MHVEDQRRSVGSQQLAQRPLDAPAGPTSSRRHLRHFIHDGTTISRVFRPAKLLAQSRARPPLRPHTYMVGSEARPDQENNIGAYQPVNESHTFQHFAQNRTVSRDSSGLPGSNSTDLQLEQSPPNLLKLQPLNYQPPPLCPYNQTETQRDTQTQPQAGPRGSASSSPALRRRRLSRSCVSLYGRTSTRRFPEREQRIGQVWRAPQWKREHATGQRA